MSRAVPGIERIAEHASDLALSEFRGLRQLSITQSSEEGAPTVVVTMDLVTENRSPNIYAIFEFAGARDIRINVAGNEARVVGFDVFNIADRQWDGVEWEVVDFENSVLHLLAREAHVTAAGIVE